VIEEQAPMRKSGTYFEQIPLSQLKDIAVGPIAEPKIKHSLRSLHHVLHCRTCGKPVAIETAKTDGDGQAVHEECYLISVRRRSQSSS
jgi:hypothetical protein